MGYIKFLVLSLLLLPYNLFGQKLDKLVFKAIDPNERLIMLNHERSVLINPDSTKIFFLERSGIIDSYKLTPGQKLKKMVIVNEESISVYFTGKMASFSFSGSNFIVSVEVPHDKFEVPMENPILIDNLIFGSSKLKNPQEGKQVYKYSYKDEYSLRDFTLPLDVKSNYKYAPQDLGIFINEKAKEAYFSMPDASTICIFRLKNKKTNFFTLPPHDIEKERWMYFYDHLKDHHYLVQQSGNKKHKLFEILDDFTNIRYIKDVNFIPNAFLDGYMHEVRDVKEKNKVVSTHYLTPIFSHDESKTKVIKVEN
jgi:hypothetical protein